MDLLEIIALDASVLEIDEAMLRRIGKLPHEQLMLMGYLMLCLGERYQIWNNLIL